MKYVDQELTVEDMLDDPIVQLLMRYDGVSASDVRHTIVETIQKRAKAHKPNLPGTATGTPFLRHTNMVVGREKTGSHSDAA
ncbi:hypothetical protein LPB41_27545 [Thalassospira sp. MA62]|nr:hypothetical protein [Thalassospira sp. MA62]